MAKANSKIYVMITIQGISYFLVINSIRKKHAYCELGIAFILFSYGHFVKTDGMVEMLLSWVPLRLEIIYVTGVLEMVIGISLFPRIFIAKQHMLQL